MLCVGNYNFMTHWNEMVNHTAVLTVDNAAFANQGIYSASYVGDSPLNGAWMRLIVRGLLGPHTHTHTAANAHWITAISMQKLSIIYLQDNKIYLHYYIIYYITRCY